MITKNIKKFIPCTSCSNSISTDQFCETKGYLYISKNTQNNYCFAINMDNFKYGLIQITSINCIYSLQSGSISSITPTFISIKHNDSGYDIKTDIPLLNNNYNTNTDQKTIIGTSTIKNPSFFNANDSDLYLFYILFKNDGIGDTNITLSGIEITYDEKNIYVPTPLFFNSISTIIKDGIFLKQSGQSQNEHEASLLINNNCLIQNLYVTLLSKLDKSNKKDKEDTYYVIVVRKNGEDTKLMVQIDYPNTKGINNTDIISFSSGDLLSIEIETDNVIPQMMILASLSLY